MSATEAAGVVLEKIEEAPEKKERNEKGVREVIVPSYEKMVLYGGRRMDLKSKTNGRGAETTPLYIACFTKAFKAELATGEVMDIPQCWFIFGVSDHWREKPGMSESRVARLHEGKFYSLLFHQSKESYETFKERIFLELGGGELYKKAYGSLPNGAVGLHANLYPTGSVCWGNGSARAIGRAGELRMRESFIFFWTSPFVVSKLDGKCFVTLGKKQLEELYNEFDPTKAVPIDDFPYPTKERTIAEFEKNAVTHLTLKCIDHVWSIRGGPSQDKIEELEIF